MTITCDYHPMAPDLQPTFALVTMRLKVDTNLGLRSTPTKSWSECAVKLVIDGFRAELRPQGSTVRPEKLLPSNS